MKTPHRGKLTGRFFFLGGGDTCDGMRWSAVVQKASKSQKNGPFLRIVWPGLYVSRPL